MSAFGALAATGSVGDDVWLRALKLVAVAVVLDAVIGMARRLARTPATAVMAILTGVVLLLLPTSGPVQVGCLAVAGLLGLLLFRSEPLSDSEPLPLHVGRRTGAVALAAFAALLLLLPPLSGFGTLLELADAMYRAGALVFGGGHVVLPLMQAETVPDLVSEDAFLAGYGAAQALPGPLFTFATYLGQVAAGFPGALVSTISVFLPGFLILLGILPFWLQVRSDPRVQAGLVGVNAAVVGLLGAALIDPIATSAVTSGVDVVFAAALFVALHLVKAPPWLIVLAAVLASPLLGL
jgi:chromate transporter